MINTSNLQLQDFIDLKDTNGNNVFADIVKGDFTSNLVNAEIYGIEGMEMPIDFGPGNNCIMEYTEFSQVKVFNDDNTQSVNKPKLTRNNFILSSTYQHALQWNRLDIKSKEGWSDFVGRQYANAWAAIRDVINLISMETLINTALATGSYKILSALGTSGKTKQEYFDDAQKVASIMDKIAITRTAYNLGESPERIFGYWSYDAYRQLNIGFAGNFSGANLAFEAVGANNIGMFGGYKLRRTLYLGQDVLTSDSPTNGIRNFNFKDVPVIVKSIDTMFGALRYFNVNWNDLGGIQAEMHLNNFINFSRPLGNSVSLFTTHNVFNCDMVVKPSRETLNCVFFTGDITLSRAQAARDYLRANQPGIYTDLAATITQAEVDAWNLAAKEYTI